MEVRHFLAADLRDHGHRRMMRIELLDRRGERLDALPDIAVFTLRILHLVAERPAEQGGMLAVLFDDLTHVLLLALEARGIIPLEPLAHLAEPNPGADGETE